MKLAIDGMHCQACVQRVRRAIENVEGAKIEQVDVGSAQVAVDAAREAAVLAAVQKAGYQPHKSE